VRTSGGGSSAIIVLGDRSVVMMQRFTTLTLPAGEDVSSVNRVKVGGGKIWFAVRKVGAGQRFDVETDEAVASVRGTEFLVEREPDGDLSVTTADGEVDVSPPGQPAQRVQVTAGMHWLGPRAALAPGGRWPVPRPVNLLPLVRRWGPMLDVADQVWPLRREGRPRFWQERFRLGPEARPHGRNPRRPGAPAGGRGNRGGAGGER
jgi:hypothetical protein